MVNVDHSFAVTIQLDTTGCDSKHPELTAEIARCDDAIRRFTNSGAYDTAAYRRSVMKHRAEYESIKRGRALDAEQAMQSVLCGSQQDIDHPLVGPSSAG